jgi:hypothetical protein
VEVPAASETEALEVPAPPQFRCAAHSQHLAALGVRQTNNPVAVVEALDRHTGLAVLVDRSPSTTVQLAAAAVLVLVALALMFVLVEVVVFIRAAIKTWIMALPGEGALLLRAVRVAAATLREMAAAVLFAAELLSVAAAPETLPFSLEGQVLVQ